MPTIPIKDLQVFRKQRLTIDLFELAPCPSTCQIITRRLDFDAIFQQSPSTSPIQSGCSSKKPPALSVVLVDACSRIYTDELQASALKDAFLQLLSDAKRRDFQFYSFYRFAVCAQPRFLAAS
jgi:hypothetical protein